MAGARNATRSPGTFPGTSPGTFALVTGAGSGIGEAARLLAGHSARVAVLDRNDEATQHVAGLIDGAVALACDVHDGNTVNSTVATPRRMPLVRSRYPREQRRRRRPASVAHGRRQAVASPRRREPHGHVPHHQRRTCPRMMEQGRGVIVNNASLSGSMPTRNEAAYSAAKAGMMLRSLRSTALEYGPAIPRTAWRGLRSPRRSRRVFQDTPRACSEPIHRVNPVAADGLRLTRWPEVVRVPVLPTTRAT